MARQYSTKTTNNHYHVNTRTYKTHQDRPASLCRICREEKVRRY